MSETAPNGGQGAQPVFNPSAPHQNQPKLRAVRAFGVQAEEQGTGRKIPMMGVSDARQISDKVVFTTPGAQLILPKMDGAHTLDQIVAEVGQGLTRPIVEQLVAQLDDAGLLDGPVFEGMLKTMREEYDGLSVLPPATTAAFADALVMQSVGKDATEADKTEQGPRLLRQALDQFIATALKDAANPSFESLPKAIVAPHLDYPRGWFNYGAVYGRLRVVDRPDRVVILGTNHFGLSTGVTACDKGFSTPLGTCELDEPLLKALVSRLGDGLLANRYDHEREHSIELHVPWIQHVFGGGGPGGEGGAGEYPTVLGVLVHDPAVNNGESYDGNGIAVQPFAEALRAAIAELPGKTLIVSSADLSHVGPGFGDQVALAGEAKEAVDFRNKVVAHDREMLDLVVKKKPGDLISAMAWQQNPTRWCSTGNLVATLLTVAPERVDLLNYGGAMDQQGMQMVTSAAIAMY
ncbi:MAG: AmmeMemoRadiSam system protein B [Phycisphaeraceae bacterium]|nr:AmmeMemoRadiSam system protein B [Phycisphaeraceae bacterium]